MYSCRWLLRGKSTFKPGEIRGSEANAAGRSMLVGQIPHSIIIQKVRPSIWLPLMIVAWAAFTMLSAACKNFTQFCAVRFFMGFAEASTYAGNLYIMGSW